MAEEINLCFYDMMHRCSLDGSDFQKKCSFYEKSRYGNKCQHFQMKRFCQCLKAYPTSASERVKEEDVTNLFRGEDSIIEKVQDAGRFLDRQEVPEDDRSIYNLRTIPEIWGESMLEKYKYFRYHSDGVYDKEIVIDSYVGTLKWELEKVLRYEFTAMINVSIEVRQSNNIFGYELMVSIFDELNINKTNYSILLTIARESLFKPTITKHAEDIYSEYAEHLKRIK